MAVNTAATVGERLRYLRKRGRCTIDEVSKTLGVSLNTVYRWEHNYVLPREVHLHEAAAFFGVTPEWLMTGADSGARIPCAVNLPSQDLEGALLNMFRTLSNDKCCKIVGYVERMYVECQGKAK